RTTAAPATWMERSGSTQPAAAPANRTARPGRPRTTAEPATWMTRSGPIQPAAAPANRTAHPGRPRTTAAPATWMARSGPTQPTAAPANRRPRLGEAPWTATEIRAGHLRRAPPQERLRTAGPGPEGALMEEAAETPEARWEKGS